MKKINFNIYDIISDKKKIRKTKKIKELLRLNSIDEVYEFDDFYLTLRFSGINLDSKGNADNDRWFGHIHLCNYESSIHFGNCVEFINEFYLQGGREDFNRNYFEYWEPILTRENREWILNKIKK